MSSSGMLFDMFRLRQWFLLNFSIPKAEIFLECVVCATEKLLIEFQGIYSDICVHVERTVCNSCVYNSTKYLVEDSMIYYGEVTCPEPNCNGKFDYHAIREIILFLGKDKALFAQYDQHVIRQHLEQMPDFIWCAHACGSGQLHDYTGSSNPVVTCLKCQQTTCFKHRIVWHTDMSCEQYDILKSQPSENSATSKWLEMFTKQCPQCQWHIQKSEGCDHMTCRHCKHEFCWECFVDYKHIADSGASQHQPVCSHYQVKRSHHHSKDASAPLGVSSRPILRKFRTLFWNIYFVYPDIFNWSDFYA